MVPRRAVGVEEGCRATRAEIGQQLLVAADARLDPGQALQRVGGVEVVAPGEVAALAVGPVARLSRRRAAVVATAAVDQPVGLGIRVMAPPGARASRRPSGSRCGSAPSRRRRRRRTARTRSRGAARAGTGAPASADAAIACIEQPPDREARGDRVRIGCGIEEMAGLDVEVIAPCVASPASRNSSRRARIRAVPGVGVAQLRAGGQRVPRQHQARDLRIRTARGAQRPWRCDRRTAVELDHRLHAAFGMSQHRRRSRVQALVRVGSDPASCRTPRGELCKDGFHDGLPFEPPIFTRSTRFSESTSSAARWTPSACRRPSSTRSGPSPRAARSPRSRSTR